MSTKKHLFGWGDTRGVREVFLNTYPQFKHPLTDMSGCGYPPHEGDPELIAETRKLIKYLIGYEPKHVLITSGCTQGVAAAIAAVSTAKTDTVVTRDVYFPFYPGIVGLSDHVHKTVASAADWKGENCEIFLLDSPSNPVGEVGATPVMESRAGQIVWDAAYHSPTYGIFEPSLAAPPFAVMCGSFNKLTGLNGLRVGWVATNSDLLYDYALKYITFDGCAVSYVGQQIVKETLRDTLALHSFFNTSRNLIDLNRESVSQLSPIFSGQEVPATGMFALFETDTKLERLLERAGVETMDAAKCGFKKQGVRISLGNSYEATAAMVKDVLKADKRKK